MPPHVHSGGRTASPPQRRGRLALLSLLAALLSGLAVLAIGITPASADVPDGLIITDSGGPDDWTNPNRADLSQMGFVDNGDSFDVVYSIDDTDLLSGGELVQSCSLYDTNGNGDVDYALCSSFSDGEIGGPTLYSCTDGFADKCKNPSEIPYTGECSYDLAADDPFAGDAGHQSAGGQVAPSPDTDFEVSCTVPDADVGGATASLLNVCTYPAGPPNSDAKDCVVSPGSGFLIVEKEIENGGDETFFFTLAGGAFASITTVDGSGSTNPAPLLAGTYSVAEDLTSGPGDAWELVDATCDDGSDPSAVDLGAGETVICTFTNSLRTANLTLLKQVENDNGGEATADEWTLIATAVDPDATGISGATGVNGEVLAGDYDLSEIGGASNYSLTGLSCDGGTLAEARLTLEPGDDVRCTFVNDDDAASLTLVKQVTNDNGGLLDASAFTLSAGDIDVAGSADGVVVTDQAGVYALSESDQTGYLQTGLSCEGATLDDSVDPPTVTVGLGDDVTCTFVNDDIGPSLTLVKEVTNDNGGTAVATDWTLTAEGYVADEPEAGTYDLSESGPEGYELTSLTCTNSGDAQVDQVTLGLGEQVTCTFVNDDIAPSLTLVKEVVNDDGGTAVAGNWELFAAGYDEDSPMANEAFALTESDGPAGYTLDSIECVGGGNFDDSVDPPTITLGLDDDVTCTFTNDDIAPGLELSKKVVNDNGGEATKGQWTLAATDADGVAFDGNPGTYKLTESGGPDGYELTGVECEGGVLEKVGEDYFITIALGESVECTFTNDDIAPSLTLIKLVENDEGRTAVPGDFTLYAGDNEVIGSPIGEVATDQAGTYELTEKGPDGYTLESLTCDNSGAAKADQVTVALGEDVTCTFVNGDDIIPDPAIDLNKDAEPATARIFDEITYTFTATNSGNVPLSNVTITDPLPGLSPITCNATTEMGKEFTGNGTGTLEVGDTIVCTATVTVTPELVTDGTVDNVAEAAGEYPGDPAQVVDDDGAVSVIIITDVEGCTFTQGYWRTHAGKAQPNGKSRGRGKGPRADATWHEIVGGPDADFGTTGGADYTYYQALWASPEGDAWLILAQQYIAAELNGLKAETTTSVDAVIGEPLLAEARALLDKPGESWTDVERVRALELSEVFDQYNNGEIIYYAGGVFIGPPHCE